MEDFLDFCFKSLCLGREYIIVIINLPAVFAYKFEFYLQQPLCYGIIVGYLWTFLFQIDFQTINCVYGLIALPTPKHEWRRRIVLGLLQLMFLKSQTWITQLSNHSFYALSTCWNNPNYAIYIMRNTHSSFVAHLISNVNMSTL